MSARVGFAAGARPYTSTGNHDRGCRARDLLMLANTVQRLLQPRRQGRVEPARLASSRGAALLIRRLTRRGPVATSGRHRKACPHERNERGESTYAAQRSPSAARTHAGVRAGSGAAAWAGDRTRPGDRSRGGPCPGASQYAGGARAGAHERAADGGAVGVAAPQPAGAGAGGHAALAASAAAVRDERHAARLRERHGDRAGAALHAPPPSAPGRAPRCGQPARERLAGHPKPDPPDARGGHRRAAATAGSRAADPAPTPPAPGDGPDRRRTRSA